MATAEANTIEIKDIEGIKELVFDMPDGGGVLVLKGDNAAGKSTAIKVLRALTSGSGRLQTYDHAKRGTAKGFGASVSVTSQTRHSGEAEVPTLEGRFDFSDLVNPMAKTEETRDKIRIKALLGLTGVKADPALFYDLVGGKSALDAVARPETLNTDDLVEQAARIKADLERAARSEEDQAENAEGRARGAQGAVEGVDLSAESDAHTLQTELEEAIREESRLKQQATTAIDAKFAMRRTQEALAKAESEYDGPTLDAAMAAESEAKTSAESAEQAVREAEAALLKARNEFDAARNNYSHAINQRKQAEHHDRIVAQWREELRSALPAAPEESELAEASARVAQAREAVERGALIRRAKQHLEAADQAKGEAKEHRKRSAALREAARGVDGVLSAAIPPGPLRTVGGRLVLDTKRGQGVPYDQCSTGEKWRVALPYGIQSVGAGGILPVEQDAWQDLGRSARAEVARMCQEADVWIITGEVADGELRAEVYEPAEV